ncbi:hypothetical protein EBZ57_00325 [bacterium]|jgi:hypothetical protein|nr:hypothetical protein [bacterium]
MKQKDIAVIAVIVVVSGIFSFIISNYVFVTPKDRQSQVEVVPQITSTFQQPDKRFYNSSAFDPTRIIVIGQNSNTDPFNSPGR